MTETLNASTPRFLALHALRLRGLLPAEGVAALTGLPPDVVEEQLRSTEAEGLVERREGRRGGYRLTEAGRTAQAALLAADVADPTAREALEAVDVAFLPANTRLKEICARWQLRDGEPNDHEDAAYDATVVAELEALDADLAPVLRAAADGLARLGTYADRLGSALTRLRGGELAAFARPLADSYHDVWMELHQDLLLSLGRERGAADGH